MDLLEYKNDLVRNIQSASEKCSEANDKGALMELAEKLRAMDARDNFMLDTWQVHGQLTGEGQRQEALSMALTEYHGYGDAERLPTVFLADLLHAAKPQEGFL